jgi:hypothetical protein
VGRRSHKPDPAQRRQVEAMAAYGIPESDISRVMGIDAKTLRKHYRDELDMGETKANAQVAGFLFNAARSGNVTAQIFWLKTRARWRESPQEHVHSGVVEPSDIRAKIERMVTALKIVTPGQRIADFEDDAIARPVLQLVHSIDSEYPDTTAADD